MDLLYQHLETPQDESFLTVHVNLNYFEVPLHYHPKIEIMYVIQGDGIRIVGDRIDNFEAGDFVIVGPNVSHVWKSDKKHLENPDLQSECITLFIDPYVLNENIFSLPEFKKVNRMLQNSNKGIKFTNSEYLGNKLKVIGKSSGINKFQRVIDLLSDMAESESYEYLTDGVRVVNKETIKGDSDRLNNCLEFITDNYHRKIELKEVSDLANLTTNSFCRYFKKRTTKSFSRYLTELRVNSACKMLVNTDDNIKEIAYSSGFHSLSNFNSQFHKVTNLSPKGYRASKR